MTRKILVGMLERVLKSDWEKVRLGIDAESRLLARSPNLVPPFIAQCLLISGEDHRHGRHSGFDFIAIGRACWRRISRGTHEGASTIEQQIVRVLTGRYERTLVRKVREIGLAFLVDQSYQKKRLPAVYLSIGYYGWRMNGYIQACQRLGFSRNSLSLEEAAQLVARLKYPQPRSDSEQKLSRIARRVRHLIALYERHYFDRTYRHLYGETLCDRPEVLESFPQF